jgi:hypothetical protein
MQDATSATKLRENFIVATQINSLAMDGTPSIAMKASVPIGCCQKSSFSLE